MVRDDESYYRKRAAEELIAAEQATCMQAAVAHRIMAERYLQMIAELSAQQLEEVSGSQSA